jgi:hypothetical protein
MQCSGNGDGNGSDDNDSGGGGDNSIGKVNNIGSNSGSGSMMAAAMMAMAAAAVVTTVVVALTSGGDCGGRGVEEAESSKGGMVLNLQALGGSVGCGAVNKLTEEGTREGGGGDHLRCRGFDSKGCGLPSPLSTLSSPTLTTTMTTTTTITTTRAQSQGGRRDDK